MNNTVVVTSTEKPLFPKVDYAETLDLMRNSGAAVIEQISRDATGNALSAIVIVDGPVVSEIREAVKQVTDSW
jgi:hypothetical protein